MESPQFIIKRWSEGHWQYLTESLRNAKRKTPLWSADSTKAKMWKRASAADKESLLHDAAIVWCIEFPKGVGVEGFTLSR